MSAPAPNTGAILVGLMSGTSLDGISAAVVRFHEHEWRLQADLLHATQHAYDPSARERLLNAMHAGAARDYCRLSADLGDWLGEAALVAMQGAGVRAADVQAIASHGQTLWHEPGHSTWQIGDAARIAERTGCAVISDFRVRDMAVGGQGAPLVPMADRVLFSHPTAWRALQNIGGIGNVTLVPPDGGQPNDRVLAFDTGPGNAPIDDLMRARNGHTHDAEGGFAAKGKADENIVAQILSNPFFAKTPPKSLDRAAFARLPLDQLGLEDAAATATAVVAASIAKALALLPKKPAMLIVAGGGARNATLLDMLRKRANVPVKTANEIGWTGDALEAQAFAFLAIRSLKGLPITFPATTGVAKPLTGGVIARP